MIRGEKVHIDLGSDSEDEQSSPPPVLPAAFVGNVLERKSSVPKPPSAPTSANKTGFPTHRKRLIESRFKQQKTIPNPNIPPAAHNTSYYNGTDGDDTATTAKSWEAEEKDRIDQENRRKLALMSADEIEEERRELMNSFSPEFLQKLLTRSNVASGSNEVDLSRAPGEETSLSELTEKDHASETRNPEPADPEPRPAKADKTVTFAEPPPSDNADPNSSQDLSRAEPTTASDSSTSDPLPPPDSVHFPRAPQPPTLDPSSETFLHDLHQKYFPSLPTDPDKLEWMQKGTNPNPYDPNASTLDAKDVRFSFRGALIPPSAAAQLPVTLGLHHHGDAPDAAGYTVAELAHLARSSYPAQRCVAFQTLGRILYRLCRGEFGDPGEPERELNGGVVEGPENTFGELARGLWREVERLQVIQILVDESEGKGVDGGRHLSAKTYAIEAVWLWRKGGGRRWQAT
jgi:hypothetical protein